jgi:hypothetical protein
MPPARRLGDPRPVRARATRLIRLLPFVLTFAGCNCGDQLAILNASVVVKPMTLDFGKVGLGGTKQMQLSLHNKGSFVLNIKGFSANAPFIAPTEMATLAPGGTSTVSAGFLPTELGDKMATLTISTNDPKAPSVTVPMTGTGIQASVKVDPPVVDFGEQLWNSTFVAPSVTVTVSNPGTDNFDCTAVNLTEDGGGAFKMTPMTVVKTYKPNDSATFVVTFNPKVMGSVSGAVHINTTAPDGADITVPLKANAVGPVMKVCGNIENMPEMCTDMGHPILKFLIDKNMTQSGSVRVENTGNRDLTIGSVLITGPSSAFSFMPSAPSMSSIVVMPNQSTPWSVTFAPIDYMFDSFIMTFATDAAVPTQSIRIEGRVKQPTIQVVPSRITMSIGGMVTTSQVPVGIFNCGDTPLMLGAITMMQTAGPVAGALSIDSAPIAGTLIQPQTCTTNPPNVPAGATFNVDFNAMANGTYMGTVTVPSDDPLNPTSTVSVLATKS